MEKWFTEKDIEMYKSAFRDLDKDGDGFLNAEDLGKAIRKSGKNLTKAELKDVINYFDANRNGVIDFDEFLNLAAILQKSKKRPELEEEFTDAFEFSDEDIEAHTLGFRELDKDGDGVISTEDLGKVMKMFGKNRTEAELEDMIKEVDADQDGVIDFNEYLNHMARREKDANPEEEFTTAFDFFDKDQDGFISMAEL